VDLRCEQCSQCGRYEHREQRWYVESKAFDEPMEELDELKETYL